MGVPKGTLKNSVSPSTLPFNNFNLFSIVFCSMLGFCFNMASCRKQHTLYVPTCTIIYFQSPQCWPISGTLFDVWCDVRVNVHFSNLFLCKRFPGIYKQWLSTRKECIHNSAILRKAPILRVNYVTATQKAMFDGKHHLCAHMSYIDKYVPPLLPLYFILAFTNRFLMFL